MAGTDVPDDGTPGFPIDVCSKTNGGAGTFIQMKAQLIWISAYLCVSIGYCYENAILVLSLATSIYLGS